VPQATPDLRPLPLYTCVCVCLQWWRTGEERFAKIKLSDEQLRRRQQAATVFSHFDKDRSGSVDRTEFAGLYQLLVKHNLTRRTQEKCLEELDANNDGNIQLNEFVDWLGSHEH
jgi:Ca2+-binding EF-hand superfamily protein